MKTHLTRRALPAFTLVETTIIVSVSLSLLSLAASGARSWKHNSDRAECLSTLRNIQMSVREYQNLYGYSAGSYHVESPSGTDIAQNLYRRDLISKNQYDIAIGKTPCDGGGTYTRLNPDRFPLPGVSYLNCSLSVASENHAPEVSQNW